MTKTPLLLLLLLTLSEGLNITFHPASHSHQNNKHLVHEKTPTASQSKVKDGEPPHILKHDKKAASPHNVKHVHTPNKKPILHKKEKTEHKKSHHMISSKTKTVAKPRGTLKTTAKVSHKEKKEEKAPKSRKVNLVEVKNRAKIRKYAKYQVGAPTRIRTTKSPVNKHSKSKLHGPKHGQQHGQKPGQKRERKHGQKHGQKHGPKHGQKPGQKHGQKHGQQHGQKNGQKHGQQHGQKHGGHGKLEKGHKRRQHGHKARSKKRETHRKLYNKHVGHTDRKHRRRGAMHSREEYLRRLRERRRRRHEYLRQFNERRRDYLRRLKERRHKLTLLASRRKNVIKPDKKSVKSHHTAVKAAGTASKNSTSLVHHHDKATKTKLLKKYLKKKTEAERQKHDAERKVVQAYLLFKLYEMVRNYLKKENSCQKHFLEVKVGADSPAFGGWCLFFSEVLCFF